MELSELTAYAYEKYQIQEQHKWADFPGFSVLCHPGTGKWVALLMRQWDHDTGTEIECCDLKCGRDSLALFPKPYLSHPVRMLGMKWISVAFDRGTEKDVVFQLFDKAIAFGNPHGAAIVLESRYAADFGVYQDTALPFAKNAGRLPGNADRLPGETLPKRLRQMRQLYDYGAVSREAKAKSFYLQAVLMEDYEDDVTWSGDFFCFFPTYQDMTTRQLRGYFTWRAQLRKGNYEPVAASAAYLYIYELLNGVGAPSPEACLDKLKEFETGYLDAGFGDKRMRQNLRRWMLEYAVVKNLPPEKARQAADPDMIASDIALSVLKMPGLYGDDEVFSALGCFGGNRISRSPVITNDPERGKHLFCEVWRAASAYHLKEKSLFTLCFGGQTARLWYPLSNAVCYMKAKPADREYILDECRSFRCSNGVWHVTAFEKLLFDRGRFQGLLHEADALLRRYLKTGRYLKENPADQWADTFIAAVIEADKKALAEAARPQITIDLSGLERIRRDAIITRDSLLTSEELSELERSEAYEEPADESFGEPAAEGIEESETIVSEKQRTEASHRLMTEAFGESADEIFENPKAEVPEGSAAGATERPAMEQASQELPLDVVQRQILRTLLQGGDVTEIIRENHLMPSIAADFINEVLFDEIGDSVLVCEDDRLFLVEDYIEDIEQLLGGTIHGGT